MAISVTFDSAEVSVDPGATVSCRIRVANDGMTVDQVLLDVLGDATAWASVEPALLNLLPGSSESARVSFHPPRSPAPAAGGTPFAVRAMSQEDPAGSAIEEGTVTVGGFTDVTMDIVPRTSSGRRAGRHKLVVGNRGNLDAEARVTASDPDAALEFTPNPPTLVVAPGTAAFVRLRAAPRKRFLRGANRSLPFQAFLIPSGDLPGGGAPGAPGDPLTADGTMLQRQVMPEWLLPACALLCVVVVALAVLWFTLLKPEVHAAATEAVTQQTQTLASSAGKADKAADKANSAAVKANTAASAAAPSAGGSGSAAGGAGTKGAAAKATGTGTSAAGAAGGSGSAAAAGTPVSALLTSHAAAASTGVVTYPITGEDTLSVSDLVLENPGADTGMLDVRAGTTTLFEFSLADFRDQDYHFVQPLTFTKKAPLELAVTCQDPPGTTCSAALSFSAVLRK